MKKTMNVVFVISLIIVLAISAWGIAHPASFGVAANGSMGFITNNFGWLYVLGMTLFVVFAVWIGFFSKYKNVRLGPADSTPEYSNFAWFGMLFSAGMGVGLVFWGVAEPLNYYVAPLMGIEPMTKEAMRFAFARSYMHWGLHPWANYCALALPLAYIMFRHNKPGLISSIFIPLVGDKAVKGIFGKVIDIFAIFATAAGVATSLGLGVYQINSGLNFLFGIPETVTTQMILVAGLCVIYTWTAVAGIDKGINTVCDINVKVAGFLMAVLLILGPTIDIINNLVEGVGVYLGNLVEDTFATGQYTDKGFFNGWTIFYWAWWVAWAPFTGSFVARISRGRTIGEFVKGVMLVPAAVSIVWFAIFGSIGINAGDEVIVEAVKNTSLCLFQCLSLVPMGKVWCIIIFVLICTFFITSANSATFVLGMYSEHGDLNPSNKSKVIWGVLMAALAAAMMVGGGNGLGMLQTLSIVGAFPFLLIMLAGMPAMVIALRKESNEK